MTANSPLITTVELLGRLRSGQPPILLDVRWSLTGPPGIEQYAAGHLPDAVFIDLDRELSAPRTSASGRHPLPDLTALQAVMRRAGISDGSEVVAYDANDSTSSARAWWVLRWAGFANVAVLDGGLAAWVAASGPVTVQVPRPELGHVVLSGGGLPVLDAAAAGALPGRGLLLDARALERYRGEREPVDPVAGHIPGAVSAPTSGNLSPDGRFLDAPQLRRRFTELGADSGEVGVYCGSGVTAAHQILAMEIAGLTGILYPGSWSEWIVDPQRPVATG